MKLPHLVVSTIAVLTASVVAQTPGTNRNARPYEPLVPTVALCTHLGGTWIGEYDEPFQCDPFYDIINAGQQVSFEVWGAVDTPFVLYTGTPVVGCQPVSNYLGGLALWAPIITLHIGVTKATPAAPPRDGTSPAVPGLGWGVFSGTMPMGVPSGMDFRFQAFGVGFPPETPEAMAFSRPIELRVR